MLDFLRRKKKNSRSILQNTRIVINNISHEIRTPLNAIMGFAETLYENETDKDKKEALLAIKDNGDRLFSLAIKLIDFSSIETGQFEIKKEYFSSDSLLMVLKNKYKNQIQKKKLLFEVNNSIPENYRIYSDYGVVFEILEMLLENALKFTDSGSIIIETSYERGALICQICDTGCGVPDSKKEMIFQLYKQGNSDLNREYEGLGLGLTIAQKLTELLGGSLIMKDNENRGSCFIVNIKMPYIINEQNSGRGTSQLIPDNLSDEKKKEFKQVVYGLSDCIKVFNADKIKIICAELRKISDDFEDLSDRIKKTADTYNEAEFSQILEEMLKGIEDEE